jgi:2',3'-cyclic-nucleotide 2'-phosphodiesterase (5'-nucleotidase family)
MRFRRSGVTVLSYVSLLLFVGCASMEPVPPSSTRFKILQINDVYKIEGLENGQSGGLARLRTLRKHLESDGTPVLLLHAGDALYPSVMSKYLDARPMVDVMNLLDGDPAAFDPKLIVTFGNHEFDKSDPGVLIGRLRESAFEWVATNTTLTVPDAPVVKKSILMDAGGTSIGIFGLLYPIQKSYARSSDVKAAARVAVAALREDGARVIIAITHQDMPADVDLVKDVPGIDLVIGGHDHLFMQQKVNETWIAKADADAKSVIVYDVTVPRAGPIRTTPLRVVLDTTVAKDPAVDAAVQRWLAALSEKLGGNETIGATRNLLEGVEPAVRGRETALGNLLADAAREQMQTDVAVINGGSIRINDNIPPGPITRYDMEGVFYYTNKLVAVSLSGQELLDMLRNSVSRADAGDGRFLQVSGLRFTYHPPQFTIEPSDVTVGGKPLDLSARYSVALIDYMYTNGIEDGYVLFTDATRPPRINTDREADFRTTVESYIRRAGTVTTAVEGRITRP